MPIIGGMPMGGGIPIAAMLADSVFYVAVRLAVDACWLAAVLGEKRVDDSTLGVVRMRCRSTA